MRETMKDDLDYLLEIYYHKGFIENDPISIPHRYQSKNDIEVSGFFAAIMAWGKRSIIIQKADDLMNRMDKAPFDFVMGASLNDLSCLKGFVHRTFNASDLQTLILGLRHIYSQFEGPDVLIKNLLIQNNYCIASAISGFRNELFKPPHLPRSEKHFSDPIKNAAAKRFNMYLRWMVRKDEKGVDFGLWDISPRYLVIPLDVHVSRNARKMGLLQRKTNDWKAAMELTENLRMYDAGDPVKYDYALFSVNHL